MESAILNFEPRALTADQKTVVVFLLQVFGLVMSKQIQPIIVPLRIGFNTREAIWLPEKRFDLCFVLFCNNVVTSLSFNSFPLKLDDAARDKEKELRQKRVRSLLTQIYSVCC